MLSTNKGGIHFYEMNRFSKVQRCRGKCSSAILLIDFYCIEDKWMDSFLYFYSPKGAHVDYNSTITAPDTISLLLLLGGTLLFVFVTYSVFQLIRPSLVCYKQITDHSIPKHQRYLLSYAPASHSKKSEPTPLN